jgi:hypothetical protein
MGPYREQTLTALVSRLSRPHWCADESTAATVSAAPLALPVALPGLHESSCAAAAFWVQQGSLRSRGWTYHDDT